MSANPYDFFFFSHPTLSTTTKTTTSESSKAETEMDMELIGLQMDQYMLANEKIINGMGKEQLITQTDQSMLENGKTTNFTAKGLNTLLMDRYLGRECGQIISMLEKDNYNHEYYSFVVYFEFG